MSWTLLIDPISRLLDKLIPDPEARAQAQLELMRQERAADLEEIKLALSVDQSQNDINKVEAQHASVFVAGWRPFIGWVCGFGMAYHFIAQPLLAFLIANASDGKSVILPVFDMDALNTVLLGMLGLGGMRTFEKIKGVASSKLKQGVK